MAELATAFVRVRPNLTGFKGEAEAGTRQAGAALGKVFAIAFGGVALAELGKVSVEAAATQQAAIARVQQITKSAGAENEAYGKSIKENLIDLAQRTGFSVEDLAQGFGRLQQQTKNTQATLTSLGTAADVARARGQGLAQVATAITRAYAGNAQGLGRLGIILPKYTAQVDALEKAHAEAAAAGQKFSAQENINYKAQLDSAAASDKLIGSQKALAEVQARFQGQGSIFGETAAGQVARFHVAITELEVSVGTHLLPYISAAAEAGREWADELGKSGTLAKDVDSTVRGLAEGFGAVKDVLVASGPALNLAAKAFSTIAGSGIVGPAVAAYAAYKGLAVAIGLVNAASIKLGITTVANTVAATANTATVAEQTLVYRANAGFVLEDTVAVEANAAAQVEGAAAARGFALSLALTNPVGASIAALALGAGAIYYFQTQATRAGAATKELSADFANLNASLAAGRGGAQQAAADVKALDDRLVALGSTSESVGGAKAGGFKWGAAVDGAKAASGAVKDYVAQLQHVLDTSTSMTAAQRLQVERLQDIAEATNRIPTRHETTLVINDRGAFDELARFNAAVIAGQNAATSDLLQAAQGVGDKLAPAGFLNKPKIKQAADLAAAGFDAAIGAHPPPPELGKKFSVTIADATSTGLSQGITQADVTRQVAQSLRDAVTQAKQSLSSIGSTLGGQIGQVMDAALAAAEAKLAASPAAQAVKRLTAEAERLQAASASRDAGQQIANQLAALQGLQRAFGPGAHTADQDLQLAQAQTAYQDAIDSQKATADTAQASSLQTQLDNQKASLEKRNEAEKTAAARRIADLNDEVNRGLITQQQYVSRLNALLRREGVNYKAAGSLLGKAFADGFQEQLAGAIKQARALGVLTPAQRGRGTGAAPIITDPRKVAAATGASLNAQLRTQRESEAAAKTASNTADAVAELKKLGAIINQQGSRIQVTIPPGKTDKEAAQIVKLAKALK